METRKADLEEIPAIVKLKYKMFEESGMAPRLHADFNRMVTEDYRELYRAGTAQHFVIEQEGSVIACAGGFIRNDAPYRYLKLQVYGFIADVYVEPAYRRKGFARTLTNEVLAWFAVNNVRLYRLGATDAARPLYESLGFTSTNEMGLFR
ncbi:GNAT family N-acetyltransferase [Paenibacillus sp. UNC451MF]|uniref:GNAT family N-acetyltransferase n=1 Tax=Paenibacillus sp. UNC451MF TaxID=1449063 RepID=UPI00069053C9|nr:GNAT family N-acetyltransferase [Paenibacillus sp. UNC451MF]